jgi:hypothetical protein
LRLAPAASTLRRAIEPGNPSAASTATIAAAPKDVASVDAIIAALYDANTVMVDQKRDGDRCRSLFVPGARLMPTFGPPNGKAVINIQTVDDYVRMASGGPPRHGFSEREIARTSQAFGNIMQVFSTYETHRDSTGPASRPRHQQHPAVQRRHAVVGRRGGMGQRASGEAPSAGIPQTDCIAAVATAMSARVRPWIHWRFLRLAPNGNASSARCSNARYSRRTLMSIFVSHSQQDEAVYSNFCLALDGSGIDQWKRESMAIGDSLADQLRAAIRRCDACVFLATNRSLASEWCMAELGAFWGAGKRVIVFLAEHGISEAQLPAQFQGDLPTRDARKVLDTIRALSGTRLDDVLTPDLVLLLRYLERDDRWTLPDFYGKSLAVANGVAKEIGDVELRGWKRAVRYGLLYLAHQGLAQKQSDTSVTYTISDYGKDVLQSPRVRQRFRESFDKVLLPLSGSDG